AGGAGVGAAAETGDGAIGGADAAVEGGLEPVGGAAEGLGEVGGGRAAGAVERAGAPPLLQEAIDGGGIARADGVAEVDLVDAEFEEGEGRFDDFFGWDGAFEGAGDDAGEVAADGEAFGVCGVDDGAEAVEG